MSSKVACYLRTLRIEWGLTQKELSSLLPKGDRDRVRSVELGRAPPNAAEILAYPLIFGLPAGKIFPKFSEDTAETVMQRAYRLSRRLEGDASPKAGHKRELLERLRARAIKSAQQSEV